MRAVTDQQSWNGQPAICPPYFHLRNTGSPSEQPCLIPNNPLDLSARQNNRINVDFHMEIIAALAMTELRGHCNTTQRKNIPCSISSITETTVGSKTNPQLSLQPTIRNVGSLPNKKRLSCFENEFQCQPIKKIKLPPRFDKSISSHLSQIETQDDKNSLLNLPLQQSKRVVPNPRDKTSKKNLSSSSLKRKRIILPIEKNVKDLTLLRLIGELPKPLSYRKICSKCGRSRCEHGELGFGNKCIYQSCGRCGAGIQAHQKCGKVMGFLCTLTIEEGAIPNMTERYDEKIRKLVATAGRKRRAAKVV
jgi:hypothetical protein